MTREDGGKPPVPDHRKSADGGITNRRGPPTRTRTRRTKLDRKVYGHVNPPQFWSALSLSTLFLLIVAVMTFSIAGTVAGTVLGGGVGGFVASFGTVNADQGTIFPVLDEQPACENAPQLLAVLRGETTIHDELEFHKDLPLPGGVDYGGADMVRISIVGDLNDDEVFVRDMDLRMSALIAEKIDLESDDGTNVEISEFGPDTWDEGGGAEDRFSQDRMFGFDDADYEFGISAEGENVFILEGGSAIAHSVSFGEITLPNVDMFLAMGSEDDFEQTSVDPRVVRPEERSCDALVEG